MQRCLVTGGAGFIGCHLVEKLVDDGREVLVYDNLSFGKLENIKENINQIQFIEGDINDYSLLEKTFRTFRPDIVFHLAAIHFIPYCNAHPREAVYVNVDGSHAITKICSLYPPQKLIFASTAAVYPPSDNPHSEIDESTGYDIYGATKMFGESLMHLFARQTQIPTISCRFFNAYGPKETNDHVIPHIVKQLENGEISIKLGNIEPKRDYIYTTDMVDALIKIAEKTIHGYEVLNIATGSEFSVEELVKIIRSILKKEIKIESVDEFKRKSDRPHLCANISRIKETVGWTPQYDIKTGLTMLLRNHVLI